MRINALTIDYCNIEILTNSERLWSAFCRANVHQDFILDVKVPKHPHLTGSTFTFIVSDASKHIKKGGAE